MKKLLKSLSLAACFLVSAESATAQGYTEIYNAPPTGAAVRSFLPFKLHYDLSGQYLLTALYVDEAIQQPSPDAPSASDASTTAATPTLSAPIYFAFNSDIISRSEDRKIKKLAEQAAQSAQTVVIGRADTIGNSDYNLALSNKRAERVAARLQKYGVPSGQLEISALGETQPSVDCSHLHNKKRRVSCEQPNRATLVNIY